MADSSNGNRHRGLLTAAKALLRDTVRTSLPVFRIIIPVSIITRILCQLGVVNWLGAALGPLMLPLGLPGSMGLVLATCMLTGLYAAMVVFAALAPAAHLTVAQVTVLATMMLVAHGLPVELRIAQKAGPRLAAMTVLRIGGAFLLGWLLHQVYRCGSFLQRPNVAVWNPPLQPQSWLAWAAGEARNLGYIFCIILALLFLMRLLSWLRITELLTRVLEPALTTLGISRAAAPVTIVGMTLGLTFGGGLIIHEAHSGRLGDKDVFFSLSLMGLCHSLIEDTLLMLVLGAHLSGILWGRLLFAAAVLAVLVRVVARLPDAAFSRYCFQSAAK